MYKRREERDYGYRKEIEKKKEDYRINGERERERDEEK